ncbi:DUF2271 domain-containing protein [Salipiger thiooxidans]|jgi:thiamine biosynthesis lipoprotein|uniref:DUF2271 domain-containing protein n=1 Tax=Salipiger thiooxidans TaxID=282683 RepID=UPI001CFB53D9|nr:DUF2271 domain-containing protein [Salipiger thiooxidans]
MKNSFLKAGTAAIALTAMTSAGAHAGVQAWRFHADHILGTSLDVTAVATDEAAATNAAEAVRSEIARLDLILSGWCDDSELASLNRASARYTSSELYTVLRSAAGWRAVTDGAFDERLGEVEQLWRKAASGSEGPDEVALGEAIARAIQHGEPCGADNMVRRGEGVRFTLDGFAKGVIIDAALEAGRRAAPGVVGLLVDIGGDMRCWGRSPSTGGWLVGIADPLSGGDNIEPAAVITLTDKAVATSGRGDRDLRISGRSYSHLLDAKSGRPVETVAGVTVVADRAADADALATAFSVMNVEASMALADRLPGVAARITLSDGRHSVSTRWSAWWPVPAVLNGNASPPLLLAQSTAQQSQAWPAGFALSIQYEVPEVSGGRYRRPYLAIWVTDSNGRAVRTITLLGTRPGWQRGNYRWSRLYASAQPTMVDATARPTRGPGRYTAVWDGRDDAGRPVPQGVYTIHVEAIREYGGQSYGYADVNLLDAATQREMRPREEFGGLRLVYGPAL